MAYKFAYVIFLLYFRPTTLKGPFEITVAVSCNWHIIRPKYINMQANLYFLPKLFAQLIILLYFCSAKVKTTKF